ncbi:TonB-dependent receptor domain-containing protein [Alteraurantiacibacter aquimixticola]|uniref:TonB-dependent receptor n=1 Tax=Alteraurantiacibacter aquimixticola TaxID=2489173 RepID=A0A4T3EZN8_9SPHN|nr:TonB-dependent receptor [Alteraurantiacibacter aquimixticola]TIX50251.1 TonB-dependent receptor [Alteraurantiacibacter aquimixticola]
MTFKSTLLGAAAAVPFALIPLQALAQDSDAEDILTDVIVVSSTAPSVASEEIDPPQQVALPADAVAIAARAPGAAAIGNGALSGQLSYRGLFGERVLGRVNGQRFASGGPNAMDPPMHYAPSILVESIAIARGVAPVSEGPSLAGAVDAQLLQVPFASGSAPEVHGRLAGQYRSVDDSYAVGGTVGVATDSWRIAAIASREEGDDYEFDGGTAGSTSFERNLYGFNAGVKLGEGELFAEYRRSETDPSGNPAFAMDIQYFDTDFLQGGYRGEIAEDVGLELRIGHVAVEHLMDNYSLRGPTPEAMRTRATFAEADTWTGEASLRLGSAARNVTLGVDLETVEKAVRITNPFNADFFLDAQADLQSDRYGAFVQLREGLGAVEMELGARIDRTEQSSGIPTLGSAVPMGPVGLANAFAATVREADDTTLDAVLRLWLPGDVVTPRFTLARKTRVPSTLERFAWLPTEASYGLADGNIYVGNSALDPEVAWIAEAGVDVDAGAITFRPTIFYRRVDHFIQGTPFDATVGVIDSPVEMVANMNGDATPLMFRNVDAELYGIDFDASAELGEHLLLEGTASYVRGKRRDISDNLYRIPPASLRLAAIWRDDRWSAGAEMTAVAKQAKVSATNGETPSDGYAVVGLFASFAATDRITLDTGVENLFDAYYQPHLAGVNRVGASDVPVGERLPGTGRGVWVRAGIAF